MAANPALTAKIHIDLANLWHDHVAYTRFVIIETLKGIPAEATVARLLQNQADIGNAVGLFFGAPAGAALRTLLEEHIGQAKGILDALRQDRQTILPRLRTEWFVNGDMIAQFLATANPEAWPLDQAKKHMTAHLNETLQEALLYSQRDYAASIIHYDRALKDILMMSDWLADGIITKFPAKFAL